MSDYTHAKWISHLDSLIQPTYACEIICVGLRVTNVPGMFSEHSILITESGSDLVLATDWWEDKD